MDSLKVRVVNVVASGGLGVDLNLDFVAEAFPDVQYWPKIFPAVIFKLENPRAATLLFRNGKLVCVGAKSEIEARTAVLKVIELLKSRGIKVGKPSIAVRNIVASANLGSQIDLIKLYERAGATASKIIYEPEQFPSAAVYRMENPHVTLVIFPNGKVICCGAKKTSEIHQAVEKLKGWLEEKNII